MHVQHSEDLAGALLISTRIFNPEIDSIRLKIYWALIFLSG
jgi:hypothetical protein